MQQIDYQMTLQDFMHVQELGTGHANLEYLCDELWYLIVMQPPWHLQCCTASPRT